MYANWNTNTLFSRGVQIPCRYRVQVLGAMWSNFTRLLLRDEARLTEDPPAVMGIAALLNVDRWRKRRFAGALRPLPPPPIIMTSFWSLWRAVHHTLNTLLFSLVPIIICDPDWTTKPIIRVFFYWDYASSKKMNNELSIDVWNHSLLGIIVC